MPALTHSHSVGVAESGCHRPAAHRHSDRALHDWEQGSRREGAQGWGGLSSGGAGGVMCVCGVGSGVHPYLIHRLQEGAFTTIHLLV